MSSKKKILIFGFPHCGTSILKSIIGHCDNIDEVFDETYTIDENTITKDFKVCKHPWTKKEFFQNKYDSFIKIFIIRNPLWVFSSINKRFEYKTSGNHNINFYINTLKEYEYHLNNQHLNTDENNFLYSSPYINDLYLIRYEDMFINNFRNLKNIFDKIGLKYTNRIFDNSQFNNIINSNIKTIPTNPVCPITKHDEFRTYQINLPFINNNELSKLDLTDNQILHLINNTTINNIYPNLSKFII